MGFLTDPDTQQRYCQGLHILHIDAAHLDGKDIPRDSTVLVQIAPPAVPEAALLIAPPDGAPPIHIGLDEVNHVSVSSNGSRILAFGVPEIAGAHGATAADRTLAAWSVEVGLRNGDLLQASKVSGPAPEEDFVRLRSRLSTRQQPARLEATNGRAEHHNGHAVQNTNGHAVEPANGHAVQATNGHAVEPANGHAEPAEPSVVETEVGPLLALEGPWHHALPPQDPFAGPLAAGDQCDPQFLAATIGWYVYPGPGRVVGTHPDATCGTEELPLWEVARSRDAAGLTVTINVAALPQWEDPNALPPMPAAEQNLSRARDEHPPEVLRQLARTGADVLLMRFYREGDDPDHTCAQAVADLHSALETLGAPLAECTIVETVDVGTLGNLGAPEGNGSGPPHQAMLTTWPQ